VTGCGSFAEAGLRGVARLATLTGFEPVLPRCKGGNYLFVNRLRLKRDERVKGIEPSFPSRVDISRCSLDRFVIGSGQGLETAAMQEGWEGKSRGCQPKPVFAHVEAVGSSCDKPKNANGGGENRVVCSRVSICGSMGSHPKGPSRSVGISLMLSRLRRFDSLHSRF
jgi:hypothetical protein